MRNIQKKVSHRNRFYKSPQTQRNNPSQTKFSSIFCQMQTNIKILNAYVELDNLVIFVDKDDVLDTIITLKNYSFDILSDMSAIHLSYDSFEIFYQLLFIDYSLRIRLKTHIIDSIQSISKIHRNAIWCEREVYDMFGIKFEHHPALRRILMSDDWSGHPLRKDYLLQVI